LRTFLVLACATALLQGPAFALPADEITRAVTATGGSDVSSAAPRQFIKAFTAVALRAPARELPAYVSAAVNLRPALAPNVVAVAIKVAVKNGEKTEASASLVDHIIRAAIAANADAALAIAKAGCAAAPEFRRTILNAAISAAPELKDALAQAVTQKSVPFAFLTFSASDSGGFSWGPSMLNPANISVVGDDDTVASPEQPPTP
jgi:hypothetical protein